MRFGVHTGLQHTTYDVLRPAWRKIEDLGLHGVPSSIRGVGYRFGSQA